MNDSAKAFFVEFSPQRLAGLRERPIVVLGNLDGVHRGHQSLIQRAHDLSEKGRFPVMVFTFSPHPVEVLAPQSHFHRIFSLPEQQHLLRRFSVDGVYYQHFDQQLAKEKPEIFLQKEIADKLNPKAIVVGFNFHFGQNREGTPELLKNWGSQQGIHVEIVPPLQDGQEIVSSSGIRQALAVGDVKTAHRLLGFPFFIRGTVVAGSQRGRDLGFPTANIDCPETILPAVGVYATRVMVNDKSFASVSHLGAVPTFSDPRVRLETFVIDFSGDLYEQEIVIEFLARVRDVKKFSSGNELQAQIHKDVTEAREVYREHCHL